MRKVPTLFERDWQGDRSRVLDLVNPACQWVVDGEGVATVKYDGTAVMVRGGKLYVRYDAKPGRTPPPSFEPVGEPDPVTGHNPGWISTDPVERRDLRSYKWQVEALNNTLAVSQAIPDATYEAVGPHFQGNPYRLDKDVLWKHGNSRIEAPRDYASIREFLAHAAIEGIVWHHPNGRMAKVKSSDFGIPWPVYVLTGVNQA